MASQVTGLCAADATIKSACAQTCDGDCTGWYTPEGVWLQRPRTRARCMVDTGAPRIELLPTPPHAPSPVADPRFVLSTNGSCLHGNLPIASLVECTAAVLELETNSTGATTPYGTRQANIFQQSIGVQRMARGYGASGVSATRSSSYPNGCIWTGGRSVSFNAYSSTYQRPRSYSTSYKALCKLPSAPTAICHAAQPVATEVFSVPRCPTRS